MPRTDGRLFRNDKMHRTKVVNIINKMGVPFKKTERCPYGVRSTINRKLESNKQISGASTAEELNETD